MKLQTILILIAALLTCLGLCKSAMAWPYNDDGVWDFVSGVYPGITITDNDIVNLSGSGTIEGSVFLNDYATLNFFGGYIGTNIYTHHNSVLNLYGGQLDGHIITHHNETINFYNFDFDGITFLAGSTVANFYGTNFYLRDKGWHLPISSWELPDWQPMLYGTWDNGIDFGIKLKLEDNSLINLHVTPEPVPVPGAVMLGTIGLGFSGWLCRRNKGIKGGN